MLRYPLGGCCLPGQVKVIIGEDRECTGQMLSIDGQDGVVKLDRGKISMQQISFLCKMPRDTSNN